MKKNLLRYILLSILVFAASVVIAVATRMILVHDSTAFGFTDDQANLVTSMIEGIVGALSVGIVVYQLRSGDEIEKKENDIEEARFIFQYNQAFIQDPNMTYVEQRLEQAMLGKIREDELIEDDTRQQFINYLVYLEGLAPLILRDVIKLDHVDDLMAYRFFLAMNNPALQKDQLFEFAPYYRGCFKLYSVWRDYRRKTNGEIINEATSLDMWEHFEEYAGSPRKVRPAKHDDDLQKIAGLIYLTDPYIYPAAFGSIRRAKQALSGCIPKNDSIFGLDNIYVAEEEGNIVGIAVVLTKNSNLSGPNVKKTALPKSYEHVLKNYFEQLNEYFTDEEAYVACVSVDPRERGKGIGSLLIKYIKSKYKRMNIRLHTLSENEAAINLYEKYGFVKESQQEGYAISEDKPLCLEMLLRNSRKEL